MNTKSFSAYTSSLNSAHRLETFDEKTRRFNAHTKIFTEYGRAFEVQEPRVVKGFDFGQIYTVEMELLESKEHYQLPFEVKIRWEDMFGHTKAPSEETLQRMARAVIGEYLESHRIERGSSCRTHLIRLQIPEVRKPTPWIHPHNY